MVYGNVKTDFREKIIIKLVYLKHEECNLVTSFIWLSIYYGMQVGTHTFACPYQAMEQNSCRHGPQAVTWCVARFAVLI